MWLLKKIREEDKNITQRSRGKRQYKTRNPDEDQKNLRNDKKLSITTTKKQ